MDIENNYLENIKQQFLYYKTLGEKAINQLDEKDLFVAANENSNSIAIIISHLSGNMLSRWTNFLTTDGEKEWRNRDAEFEPILQTKLDILAHWNKGWNCFFDAINALSPNDLNKIVYIRNEGHTVIEAINRQLAHYPYHIGQIVFISKLLKNNDFVSLSIPKNKSKNYNADKFSKEKSVNNFVIDALNRLEQ